ncbi:hypothetical protein GCM10007161_04400 [Ignatzschineria indica]|uniref:Uncharacterized protein n=1 Tax=Ignatzschineria indica TaxID=472583 RepID=A0A2U2AMQ5_9GAMM|nr:hypothetical protein [Ignatzschineria indica]PWD84438.1 hypothetical protein DC082_02535 [Ignatzschineria indica]GGZ76445.1 hypothetical protein GCM10007161_04400 [Ignatzschineria indica]
MNSTQETILSRWNTFSVRGKSLLEQKAPLEVEEILPPSVILVQLSRLFTLKLLTSGLIITRSISDTIFLKLFLEALDPKLSVNTLFPKDADKPINISASDLIIAPYTLFSLDAMRRQPFNPENFDCIIVDQAVPIALIDDLFFLEEQNRSYLIESFENHPSYFLATCFSEISEPILASLPKEKIEKAININIINVPNSKAEVETEAKANNDIDINIEEIASPTAGTRPSSNTKPTAKKGMKISLNSHKKEESKEETSKDAESTASKEQQSTGGTFIAMVPRNLQRQYIRDYIREHNLQDVLVITHNRQSARLLEKYLYRARIRSRIVHEKIDDETANSLFDRYHEGQFNTLILMHRVVQDFADKITKCDAVFFLDFPTVYAEYEERLQFVQQKFNPQHFISIASENDQVWVDALFEEYPDLHLPIEIVDIKPPKRQSRGESNRNNNHRENRDGRDQRSRRDHRARTSKNNPATEATEAHKAKVAENRVESQSQTVNNIEENAQENAQSAQNSRREERTPRRGRVKRQERVKREVKPRTARRRRDDRENQPTPSAQPAAKGESQSDFFSNNHDEIVNKNRLPFESGSFEANIARENRRRNRDPFGVPGGLGQSSDGNFIQNLTQGLSPNTNQTPNSNTPTNNRRGRNNRPRTRGRKK